MMSDAMEPLHAAPGTQLLLIRHGETQWNLDQRIQGHLDIPLTEWGVEQARRLSAWLKPDPLHAVYSSDLSRAHQTAVIVAGERVPVRLEPRFREAGFGRFEGLTSVECEVQYPDAYRAWKEDALRHRPPGAETIEELIARCRDALVEILPRHPGESVAIVAHGGPVRAMLCGTLGLPLRFYPKIRVDNTSVARVYFTERGPMLAGVNDVAHLRASAFPYSRTGWEEK